MRHVPPIQMAHRARLRAQRWWYQRQTETSLRARWSAAAVVSGASSPGWPEKFEPTDAVVAHPAISERDDGRFLLLGEAAWPLRDGWRPAERSQLFRYHLHYFDWVWSLVPARDHQRFAVLWRSWEAVTRIGRWDEWSPYVVSLRAWNLCAVYHSVVADSTVADEVRSSLGVSLGYLRDNLERDVGGNHLLKNLKAVFGLAVFFDLADLAGWALAEIDHQVVVQVLDDGGHFELSPGYHVQVLADLVDVTGLADAAGLACPPLLRAAVGRMAEWLDLVSFPDGTLPLLGDTTPQDPALLGRLRELASARTHEAATVLAQSGLVVVRPRAGAMAVFDFGRPCPEELPAHAQADWGTFELWLDGERIVLDPGVSAYVGERRAWERSTCAHNTLTIDDRDQTEVWGSFRAGRRAVPGLIDIELQANLCTISAGLTSYGGRQQQRTVTVTAQSLEIVDVTGPGTRAVSALNMHPDHVGRATTDPGATVVESQVEVGEGFGRLRRALRLEQDGTTAAGRTQARWSINLRSGDSRG